MMKRRNNHTAIQRVGGLYSLKYVILEIIKQFIVYMFILLLYTCSISYMNAIYLDYNISIFKSIFGTLVIMHVCTVLSLVLYYYHLYPIISLYHL